MFFAFTTCHSPPSLLQHSPPTYCLSPAIKIILYILTNATPAHGHTYLLPFSNYILLPLWISSSLPFFLITFASFIHRWRMRGLSPAESWGSLERTIGTGIISALHNLSWHGSFSCKTPPFWYSHSHAWFQSSSPHCVGVYIFFCCHVCNLPPYLKISEQKNPQSNCYPFAIVLSKHSRMHGEWQEG